jgi:hypothetical protein
VAAPLLLVFLAVADADREPALAMVEAAAQALGTEVRILVERFDAAPPTLAALASVAGQRQAIAAARVLWSDPDGSRVTVDVYSPRRDLTTHRSLSFQTQDRPSERGRAIGLVLAALVVAPDVPGPAPPRTDSAAPSGPAPAPTAADQDAGGTPGQDASVRLLKQAAGSTSAATASAGDGRWALEALAGAGIAVGGAGSGLGGGFGARRLLGVAWGLRLGAHARSGSVPAAQASSLTAGIAAGVFRSLRRSGAVSPPTFDVGLRGDFILNYHALTHFSDDDPSPVRHGRFLPAAAALLEFEWRISTTTALHLGTGLEIAFGTMHVVVRGVEVAELTPFRVMAEAGVRARF